MNDRFWSSKDFKKLNAKWAKKLKESGFEDIEQDETHLNFWNGSRLATLYTDEQFQARQEYYRIAGQFLHEYKFDSDLDRTIWEMHANGSSIRNITTYLKAKKIKIYTTKVFETIQELTKEMKLKYKVGTTNGTRNE